MSVCFQADDFSVTEGDGYRISGGGPSQDTRDWKRNRERRRVARALGRLLDGRGILCAHL